jgi:hypothetical protein
MPISLIVLPHTQFLVAAAVTTAHRADYLEAETEKPSNFKSLIDLKILKSFKSFNCGGAEASSQ